MNTTTKKFSGWSVLLGCFCLMFFANAIIAGTSALFMAPVCRAFGFDAAAYSVITLVSSIASAIAATLLAPKMQKGNMKMIMIVCMFVAAFGFAAMGLCTQLWQFYLVFAICNLGFAGVGQLPVAMLVTAWFDDKRSIAMAMAFCGDGLGTAIWAMLFSKIIAGSANGWAQCYFIGGIIILIVGCAVTLLLVKKAPQLYGQTPYIQESSKSTETQKDAATRDDWEGVSKGVAFKSVGFFALCIVIALIGCVIAGVTAHVVNYLVTIGWEMTQAGSIVSVFSLVGIIGLLLGGIMFEKLGARNGVIVGCVFNVIGLVALLFAQNKIFGYVYAVFFALGGMLPRLVPTLLTSKVFGVKDYASIYAILNMVFLVGCSLGGVLTGVIYNIAGYGAAWITFIAMTIIIAICTVIAMLDSKRLRAKYPNAVAPKEATAEANTK